MANRGKIPAIVQGFWNTAIPASIPGVPAQKTGKASLPPSVRGLSVSRIERNDHQRCAPIVPQGVLPFQYEQEKSSKGMSALTGLVTYLELMHAAGLL